MKFEPVFPSPFQLKLMLPWFQVNRFFLCFLSKRFILSPSFNFTPLSDLIQATLMLLFKKFLGNHCPPSSHFVTSFFSLFQTRKHFQCDLPIKNHSPPRKRLNLARGGNFEMGIIDGSTRTISDSKSFLSH